MAVQELTWRVTVDPQIAEAAMKSLARTAETSSKDIETSVKREAQAAIALQRQRSAAIISELKKIDDYQSQIRKLQSSNYINDLTIFQNALKQNSSNAKRAADDFLKLLDAERGVGKEAATVAHEGSQVSQVIRAIASSAVIAEGPLGGVAGRLRAVGAESTELIEAAGPAGLVIGGLVLATAAAGLAVAELDKKAFETAETWAHYGEEIYKAKVVTGLTAEELSVLKVVASETNTPFETLIHTAARLQTSISKGISEPSSEAGRALKFLKLDSEEFNRASPDRQLQLTAKALNEVKNQGDKNHASQALLNRSYVESATALKDLAERYDDARQQADAFGLLLSEQDVQAAHKFEEAIKHLKIGVEGLGIQVGQRTAPAIELALNDIAHTLGLNESSWRSWGELIGGILASTVLGTVRAAREIKFAIEQLPLAMLGGPLGSLEALRRIFNFDRQQEASQVNALSGILNAPQSGGDLSLSLGDPSSRFPGTSRGRGRGGRAGATEKLSAAQKLLNQLTDEYNRLQDKAEGLTRVQIVAQELLKDKYKGTSAELRNQLETEAALIDRAKEKAELDKRKAEATEKIRTLLNNQTEAIKNARLGDDQWADQIVRLEADLKKLGLTMDDGTKKLLADNAEVQRTLALTRQRIALEETLIQRLERERAVTEEIRARLIGIDLAHGDEGRPRITDPQENIRRARQQSHDEMITQTKEQLSAVHLLTDAYSGLASGIAQGIGSVIQNFVLLGQTGPGVMRKILAEALATVAAQAGAQAIYELALGFAALTPWGAAIYGPAPLHFKAAALLGTIAVGAAAIGRGVAGTAFANATGTSGALGTSSPSPSKTTSLANTPATIKEEWVQRRPIIIQLHGDASQFEWKVVNAIDRNVSTNGRARAVIIDTAKKGT